EAPRDDDDQAQRRERDGRVARGDPRSAFRVSWPRRAELLRDERRGGDAEAVGRQETNRLHADERLIARHHRVAETPDDRDVAEKARVIEDALEQRRPADAHDVAELL